MENKQIFPTEEVTLPSKGLIYPKDNPLSKGVLEMKYMTAKEEDILTNQSYIKNGTVVDKLLKSLIITPIDYNDIQPENELNCIVQISSIKFSSKNFQIDYLVKQIMVNINFHPEIL